MADAIEDLRAPSKMYQDKPGRYIQWNLGMPEWEDLMGVAFAERGSSREGLQKNLQYPWYDLFDYELDGHRLEQHGRQRRISRAPPLPYHFAMSSEWIDKVWVGPRTALHTCTPQLISTPTLSQCFRNADLFMRSTHWRMLIIGSRDGGMFNHKDILRTSSFQVQLAGRKRWHLCS